METIAYRALAEIEENLWWYKGRRKVCFDLLDRYVGKGASKNILDVGCGTGYNMIRLEQYGTVRGIDASPQALDFCHARGIDNVSLHGAGRLPFPEQAFDLVTAFDVLEHIDDDRGALLEFSRVLKPGGWLLIYTPALPWLYNRHDRIVHHKRRYRFSELEEKLSTSGWKTWHLAYVNAFVLPLVLLARFLSNFGPPDRHQEMEVPHRLINGLLTKLCACEQPLVRRSLLPIGLSLVAIAQRPEE